ncbi:GNAT family N-acetyltransferase [Nocardioides insulae]|uniref:GNAT family N-acetyltransferase n=1 Tax=Nocardioides insulae TaxID=394734 RepID=UPI0004255A97|nr:GNAT family N-acetyltransferase [Nocardioides insulae]
MSRSPVTLRDAVVADAPFLVTLWTEHLRRAEPQEQVADMELVIKTAERSAEQRLVVAEYDGVQAGAVLLQVVTMSPLNLEAAVMTMAPHVEAGFRRRGIGGALMDAAVTYAEERGIGHVSTAAISHSRDANRFLARLGFGPQATLRAATTPAVRGKLNAQRPRAGRDAGRHSIGQVLAARRSQRRSAGRPS